MNIAFCIVLLCLIPTGEWLNIHRCVAAALCKTYRYILGCCHCATVPFKYFLDLLLFDEQLPQCNMIHIILLKFNLNE